MNFVWLRIWAEWVESTDWSLIGIHTRGDQKVLQLDILDWKFFQILYTSKTYIYFSSIQVILSRIVIAIAWSIDPESWDPGIAAIFGNLEFQDWRRPNPGISGLQKN